MRVNMEILNHQHFFLPPLLSTMCDHINWRVDGEISAHLYLLMGCWADNISDRQYIKISMRLVMYD